MSTKADLQNKKLAFKMWIEMTFLEWQAENRKRATLDEFAQFIGYSRPLISMWLAGQRLPVEDGIKRLAELFGPEIYDVLDIPRPDPDLQRLTQIWKHIPEKVRQSMRQEGERYVENEDENKAKSQRRRSHSAP